VENLAWVIVAIGALVGGPIMMLGYRKADGNCWRLVKRKCTRRAFWKTTKRARSSENWIGFQIASPK
jgi:hypothetical protein